MSTAATILSADLVSYDAGSPVMEQHVITLCDLDEIVLTRILARLYDPLPLALTCKTLHQALNSPPCRQEWFNKWYHVRYSSQQPVALAVLGWKPLAGCSIENLSKFLVNTVQHAESLRAQYVQQLTEATELARSGQWVKLLRLFVPWPEHLLLMAVAASPHSSLLSQLLQNSVDSIALALQTSRSHNDGAETDDNGYSSPPVQQLTDSITSLTIQQQQSQQPNPQSPALKQHLPTSLRLPNKQQDLLQTAILSAAAAGQADCLSLLLQQLPTTHAQESEPSLEVNDLVTGAAEAAAASGSLACLKAALLWLHTHNTPPNASDQLPGVRHDVEASWQDHRSYTQLITDACTSSWLNSTSPAAASTSSSSSSRNTSRPATRSHQFWRPLFCCHSRYSIVAAASSGSSAVVKALLLLHNATDHPHCQQKVKQQLPAALIAAGRRGHLQVLRLLLSLQEVSSKPLEMAADDAAVHCWPSSTLNALLQHMAQHYRIELLQLLHKPLLKALQSSSIAAQQQQQQHQSLDNAASGQQQRQQQQQQRETVEAMFRILQSEAVTESPEVLKDVLLTLAQQGEADKVAWVLKVAPTVLVKVGPAAVAAALEGGYPHVAQLILDAGGERPAAFKAAAKRGELVAAVRNRDPAAVEALLQECSLPWVWTCESSTTSSSAATAGAASLEEATSTALPEPWQNSCLLSLLQAAASAGAPTSVALLRLLLPALPAARLFSVQLQQQHLIALLLVFCLKRGLVKEIELVLELLARTAVARRQVMRNVAGYVQLPDDSAYLDPVTNCYNSHSDHQCDSAESAAAAVPGPIAAAIALMQQPGGADVLGFYVVHPYLGISEASPYLDSVSRPSFPAMFIPCKKGLTLLFRELTKLDHLPARAKVKNVGLYKLMVRVVFQACDVGGLLHAFLGFMGKHGEGLLADVVGELQAFDAYDVGDEL